MTSLHVIGDLLVAVAYFSIPLVLYLNRHCVADPIRPIVLLFAAFILSCGVGHSIRIWNIWHSHYWVEGFWTWLTGLISLYTAIRLSSLVPQFLNTQKDLTKTRRLLEQDTLTSIANRLGLEQAVQSLAQQPKSSSPIQHSLVLIDLDGFKQVNDTYGHSAGDAVLKAVAQVLVNRIRAIDLAARLGGDEFAILMVGCPPVEAQSTTEVLRQSIENIQLADLSPPLQGPLVSASIGIALLDIHQPFNISYRKADRALYAAKGDGKNRVALHLEPDQALAQP